MLALIVDTVAVAVTMGGDGPERGPLDEGLVMLIDEDWLIGHASVWALVNVTHSEGVARAFGEWLCNEFEGCELEEVPGHRASWAVFVASPEGVSALADWDAELDLVGLS